GYSIYGGVQSRRQVIVRNRFSKAFQSKGLHTNGRGRWPIPKICRPGRSAGCFGTVTAAPSQLTWSGNYWDDTLKPVRFRRAPARDRRAAGR
ncbi:MAG: hypothetical protein JWP18_1552, partial [Solirubrobacterales bacterium]|nr:hypothetical protein [Solirubrobacterales bacterium]